MYTTYTSKRTRRREQIQAQARANEQSSSSSPPSKSFLRLFRMPSVFNIIRFSVYTAVCLWAIVCLAIAVHFNSILISSDLTRFVPFAIFVCSASLLLILALLGFGFWRDRNPISTRIELGCLGLAGVLWLALSAFLASSESEAADVECFSSADSTEPFDMPGFNTETYHAQYRVLEAFSIFNVILIFAFLFMLSFLAFRHHRWGTKHVWTSSVTAFPWFGGPDAQTGKLPIPVTSPAVRSKSQRSQMTQRSQTTQVSRSHSQSRPQAQVSRSHSQTRPQGQVSRSQSQSRGRALAPAPPPEHEKPAMPRRLPSTHHSPTRNEAPTYVYWIPHKKPDQAPVSYKQARDPYHRGASPRR
ncbi:hypothetical protein C8Q75DRAFT_802322 [Abortiporus biennis]|nr:hypothetical protein C8Q75DRAFT_802322 [Abortiporus biennis]